MEQFLTVFGIDWRLLTVQAVNFVLLLGLLWHFLYKPLIAFVDKRREQIIEGVAKAERAEALLRDADAEKAAIITKAVKEADGIVSEARNSAQVQAAAVVAEGEEKARRIVAEGERQAHEAERKLMEESKEKIARMVVLGVEKSLRDKYASRV